MSKVKGFLKSTKFRVFMTVCFMLAFSTVAFASEPIIDGTSIAGVDMADAIGTGLQSMMTGLFGIIAVIIPTIVTIIGAKLAITKGLDMFKSLTSKG